MKFDKLLQHQLHRLSQLLHREALDRLNKRIEKLTKSYKEQLRSKAIWPSYYPIDTTRTKEVLDQVLAERKHLMELIEQNKH